MSKSELAGPVADCVCLNLRMSSRALSQVFDEAMRPTGLKTTQFSLLRAIGRMAPVTFQKLAETMVLDQTTLPRSLRLLEKDGLIKIVPGADRRERLASLTSSGKKKLVEAAPYWSKAQERMKNKFTPERLDRLLRELAEIRKAAAV